MNKDFLKNSKEYQQILLNIKALKQPQSFLFYSSDRLTAFEMGVLVAKTLICNETCNCCSNCTKFNSNHPDVKILPEKEGQFKVEDSNFVVEESFVKPIYFDKKIFIIKDFDKSTIEAQNKLLKVLEEPNANVYYILTTDNPEKILQTIKSRCFKVKIGGGDKTEIESMINIDDDIVKNIACSLGAGFLGKTEMLANKKNIVQIFDSAKQVVCKMKSSADVLAVSKNIQAIKEDFVLLVEMICLMLEDLIKIKTNYNNINFDFIKEDLMIVKDDYSLKAIVEVEKMIREALKGLSYNVNQTLIIDNMLLKILEVKFLCR